MGLTIREIFEEVREKYPAAPDDSSLLRKLNVREQNLFRTIYRRKTATVMDILAGQFLYPLDFSKSKIIHVIVNGQRYEYEEIDDSEAEPPFLYTYQNALGLYPTPDKDISQGLFLHHYQEPRKYTLSDLDSEPDFDPDFHALHIYGLCKDSAEASGATTDVINAYVVQYNAVLEEYLKANPEPELPPMRVE